MYEIKKILSKKVKKGDVYSSNIRLKDMAFLTTNDLLALCLLMNKKHK